MLECVRALEPLVGEEHRARVAEARERLERSTFVLAVVGEFSSGKSFLLNSLLGQFRFETLAGREQIAGLLATDINPSTATITELEYAPQSEAYAYHEDGREERIPLDRLSQFVAVASSVADAGAIHDATKDERDAPTRVVVKVDSPFLRRGFTLADTPGLASINPAHRRATLQFLPGADAVLYLIDTQQPFTEGDASFLDIIRRHLDSIFVVQTKIDLWEQSSESGKPAWEVARDRIAQMTAIHAPGTYVYALSARRYAEGTLRGDAAMVEQSRFPEFVSALDASLVRNTGRGRLRRAREQVALAAADAEERIDRDAEMLQTGRDALQQLRAQTQPHVEQLQQFAERVKRDTGMGADRLASVLQERGEALADDAQRALGQAFDTADIARLRDRARLHILVDRTLGQAVDVFARELSAAVTAQYTGAAEQASAELPVRFSFANAAANAFGSTGHSNLWTEEPEKALSAAIVLEAIGGPAIALVHDIASRFAAGAGTYMKRELTADLRASIWPQFRTELTAFTQSIAERLRAIRASFDAAVDEALARAQDSALGSIDRALAVYDRGEDPAAVIRAMHERKTGIHRAIAEIDEQVNAFLARGEEIAAPDGVPETVRRANSEAEFDREAYQLGLRPERWRVAVLGALRRGKSSLINAFAGRRVLSDEVAGAIAYPVHVRYGEQESAFALQADGTWHEVEIESALEEAARNPVLILTPWDLPRELVLVHAPAFDAGDSTLEDVCTAVARASSEVLCLFSRQLSDRELALYERVAELGKPMLFAHTLADNESQADRRHVVELAEKYLKERNIPSQRIFTVSTLEFGQAKRDGRAPAGWNEVQALISTISAHAEEHMARRERLERAALQSTPPVETPIEQASIEKPRGLLARLSKSLFRQHGRTSQN